MRRFARFLPTCDGPGRVKSTDLHDNTRTNGVGKFPMFYIALVHGQLPRDPRVRANTASCGLVGNATSADNVFRADVQHANVSFRSHRDEFQWENWTWFFASRSLHSIGVIGGTAYTHIVRRRERFRDDPCKSRLKTPVGPGIKKVWVAVEETRNPKNIKGA